MKKRFISWVLIFMLILQPYSGLVPISDADSVNNVRDSATAAGKINLGGSSINYEQELKDTGNGSYTLSLEISSGYSVSDTNQNPQISQNQYFTATEDGDYLLELWGGSGASGQSTSYNDGGSGGAGGYIYGKISLKEGETLLYHLGGNGEKTLSSNEGGGANGDGGDHGDTGNFTVGGGGGYSVIYKFSEGEFEQKYLDENGNFKNELEEEDRATKYIMIAGGGGGGGAGSGTSLITPIGSPHGGKGGSIGHVSGTLSIDGGYDVPGTFFSGEDGKSSGISTRYIGRGGSNTPGKIVDSFLDLFKGKEPNDWKGTYNASTKGGAGGAGNLRGGGGGAGFCGGSGGIMTGITTPTNVGGGGGGSSFIADSIDYNLDAETKQLLSGTHTSETGGAINIFSMEANKDMTFLESVSFSTNISKYFDIESIETVNNNGKASSDKEGNILISNANISPDEKGYINNTLTVHIKVCAKDDFAGGNFVPILQDGEVSCTTDTDLNGTLTIDNSCRYVNVPLNFDIKTHSYMTNDNPVMNYPVSNLYEDTYESVRDNLAEHWQYDFIDQISEYKVTDENGDILSDEISNLEKSANYSVSFEVIPKKTETAVIGSVVNTTTFSEIASIHILQSGVGKLNGKQINYSKKLTFNDENQYVLSLNVKTNSDKTYTSKPVGRFEFTDNNGTYTVPSDGYYFIQAWGADGGAGEDAYIYATGGLGGKGGYVSGYSYLTQGTVLTLSTGIKGVTNATGQPFNRGNGTGGGYTSVLNGSTTLLIAGGGGGGGGAVVDIGFPVFGQATNGGPGKDASEGGGKENAPKTPLDTYYKGNTGSTTEGGAAGANFIHTSIDASLSDNPLNSENYNPDAYKSSDFSDTDKGGAIYITCLQIDDDRDNAIKELENALSDFTLTEELSNYFSVLNVKGEQCNLTYEVKDQTLTVNDINPTITSTETGQTIRSSVDFTVNVYLKPKEGFLGGNDVPVLIYEDDKNTGMILSQGDDFTPISQQDATDYANVEISETPELIVNDKTYVVGDAGINKNDLFDEKFPAVSEEWMDDFVEFIGNESDEILTPTVTTDYEFISSIKPKNEATKAAVILGVDAKSIKKTATIYVEYEVIYHLTNVSTNHLANDDGRFTVSSNADFEVMLEAEKGYTLPEEINVSIGDKTIPTDEYTYDSSTGALIILNDQFRETTGKINITAAGNVKTYTLHYVYETEPGGSNVQKHTEKYAAGADISPSFIQEYHPRNYDGYDFEWCWATEDNDALTTMPAEDWWVIGSYVPKQYKLTINYLSEDGSETYFPSVEKMITYGSSYSIESPQKDGYIANQTIVSGIMEKNLEVNVYYTATENQLNIIYIKKDTNEIVNTFTHSYATDQEFSVATPELTGYTASESVISGVMMASGVTRYVYYEPNHYTVTFNADGGNCHVSSKEVVFNNVYGYNGLAYEALPTPIKVGYEFEGWSLNGEIISEETVVNTAENHELKAVWKATAFSVTIQYLYADGSEAAEEWTQTLEFGESYSQESPSILGYQPSQEVVSGTVPAQNTIIKVIYTEKEYTLTVDYLYSDGKVALDQHKEIVRYKDVYTVTSPDITGFTPSSAVVTGKMPAENKHITVYYYKNEPTISTTVDWGDLSFDCTQGEWDPELHTYSTDSFEPTKEGSNYVKVTNNSESTVYIHAEYDYTSGTEFKDLKGYFTATNNATSTQAISSEIEPGKNNEVYLWLTGQISEEKSGNVIAGKCSVKISGGKEVGGEL